MASRDQSSRYGQAAHGGQGLGPGKGRNCGRGLRHAWGGRGHGRGLGLGRRRWGQQIHEAIEAEEANQPNPTPAKTEEADVTSKDPH